ncbi:hypothetical protein ACFY7C_37320 [Streptomyces sp. NPDC012769]|uniref:hypothetical protein n=1 Tax=Streptomyces sp. NPDC012769 TaxID=3364848 RepID=UPI0036B2FD23
MRKTTIRLIATAALALALTACGSDSSPATTSDAPAYKITMQRDQGNPRYIDVEVKTDERLHDVFDAVIADLTDEAGYFIYINCATGSTGAEQNRLANGKKAVGRKGAIVTGLNAGDTEFAPVPGKSCP